MCSCKQFSNIILKGFKTIDLFQKEPKLILKDQKTCLGAFWSWLFIVSIVFYSYYLGLKIHSEEITQYSARKVIDSDILENSESTNQSENLSQNGFRIAIGLENLNDDILGQNHRPFIHIKAFQVEKERSSTGVVTENLNELSISNWGSSFLEKTSLEATNFNYSNYACISPDSYKFINSDFSTSQKYLKLSIQKWEPDYSINAAGGCESDANIDTYIDTNNVQIFTINSYFDTNDLQSPVKKYLSQEYIYNLRKSVKKNANIYIQKNKSKIYGKNLKFWETKEYEFYHADQQNLITSRDWFYPNNFTLDIDLKLLQTTQEYEIKIYTILDLLPEVVIFSIIFYLILYLSISPIITKMLYYSILAKVYKTQKKYDFSELKNPTEMEVFDNINSENSRNNNTTASDMKRSKHRGNHLNTNPQCFNDLKQELKSRKKFSLNFFQYLISIFCWCKWIFKRKRGNSNGIKTYYEGIQKYQNQFDVENIIKTANKVDWLLKMFLKPEFQALEQFNNNLVISKEENKNFEPDLNQILLKFKNFEVNHIDKRMILGLSWKKETNLELHQYFSKRNYFTSEKGFQNEVQGSQEESENFNSNSIKEICIAKQKLDFENK